MLPAFSDYSDDESIDIHVRHVAAGPPARRPAGQPHYVHQTVRGRECDVVREARGYYPDAGPVMLQPERTVLIHTRSRSRERCSSSPAHAAPAPTMSPVIVNNMIVNELSDLDESDSDSGHRHARPRRSHSRVHSHSRPSSPHSYLEDARDKWELEKTRRELEDLRMANARARDEQRLDKQYREDAELQRAKRELDEIRRREMMEAEEKRIRREIELKALEEERREAEEKARRARAEKEAIEKYKRQEAERAEKARLEREQADKEYQCRLREDLVRSGLDEKSIEAIMKREKIKKVDEKKEEHKEQHVAPSPPQPVGRPIYTRMSLRHLDIETLLYYKLEFDYDEQPGYVIIKRRVPEWEQDILWEHTRCIRKVERKRDDKVVLALEGKKHHHHKDDEFEWVRKKERHRSKSPSLLMYLAGGRPA